MTEEGSRQNKMNADVKKTLFISLAVLSLLHIW